MKVLEGLTQLEKGWDEQEWKVALKEQGVDSDIN